MNTKSIINKLQISANHNQVYSIGSVYIDSEHIEWVIIWDKIDIFERSFWMHSVLISY